MVDEAMRLELEQLGRKRGSQKHPELSLKVSQKGALSLYGLGRFPVTLYKEQWLRLLEFAEEIKAFISQNEAGLKVKK